MTPASIDSFEIYWNHLTILIKVIFIKNQETAFVKTLVSIIQGKTIEEQFRLQQVAELAKIGKRRVHTG